MLWRPLFFSRQRARIKTNSCDVAATFWQIRDTIRSKVMGLKFKGPPNSLGELAGLFIASIIFVCFRILFFFCRTVKARPRSRQENWDSHYEEFMRKQRKERRREIGNINKHEEIDKYTLQMTSGCTESQQKENCMHCVRTNKYRKLTLVCVSFI